MDEATLGSYRSFKHPLFSVFVPFGVVWLVTWCLRAAIPALRVIPGVYPLLLLIASLSETAVSNYLVTKRAQGILPRLRELIVLLFFSFFFLKLVNGDIFRGDWTLARLDIVLAILLLAIEWLLSIVIHMALRERELLLALVTGKDRNELKECFREMGTEASNSLAGLSRVRRLIVVFQALAFLGLFFLAIARPEAVSPGIGLLALVHFAAGVVFFFSVTGYMEQQALMGEGFLVTRRISGRRAGFAAALSLVACLALIPLVGRDAPLPSSYLQDFMLWLQRITTLPERKGPIDYDARDVKSPDLQLEDQSKALTGLGEGGKDNEALQRLFRILILVLVAGGPAVVVLVLLVAPLFRKREEKLHPVRALRSWLTRAIRALAQGARNFATALRYRPRGSVERKSLREILFGRAQADEGRQADGRAGFFQRLGLSREIKTFVKVIRWGERRGVRYLRCLGPREYAGSLGSSVPEVRTELERLADIFEELLFSGRELAAQRSAEYFEAARLVLRHR